MWFSDSLLTISNPDEKTLEKESITGVRFEAVIRTLNLVKKKLIVFSDRLLK